MPVLLDPRHGRDAFAPEQLARGSPEGEVHLHPPAAREVIDRRHEHLALVGMGHFPASPDDLSLRCTKLAGGHLEGADLRNADLSGVATDCTTKLPADRQREVKCEAPSR